MMIYDELDTISDAFYFALTGSYLWTCGEHHIRQFLIRHCAPWRGHRLVCLGQRNTAIIPDSESFPDMNSIRDALLRTEWESERARSDTTESLADISDNNRGSAQKAASDFAAQLAALAWHAPRDFQDPDTSTYPRSESSAISGAAAWIALIYNAGCLSPSVQDEYYSEYVPPPDDDAHPYIAGFVPERNDWETEDEWSEHSSDCPSSESASESDDDEDAAPLVLRNLDKNEYVRSDHLRVMDEEPLCGLGRALLSRICWSSDKRTGMRRGGAVAVHRGAWAGDCFDIIPLEEFDTAALHWKDVSSEVRQELIQIWQYDWEKPQARLGAGPDEWKMWW